MARYFFDTSALVKNYHTEIGTPEVRALLTEPLAECVVSRLATVETLSGFAGKVRAGVLSTTAFAVLEEQIPIGCETESDTPDPGRQRALSASRFLDQQPRHESSGCELDAIQLAVALRFHEGLPIDRFVCTDQRLCAIAAPREWPFTIRSSLKGEETDGNSDKSY